MIRRQAALPGALLLLSTASAAEPPPVVVSVEVPGTRLGVNLQTHVGAPYDSRSVSKDVRYLWDLGRFDDVRVEERRHGREVALVFHVTARPQYTLRELRLVPNSFGVELKLPPETSIDRLRAREIAVEAERQLQAHGYAGAQVREEILPLGKGRADLRLAVGTGESIRVKEVRVEGDPQAARYLKALRGTRILPGIPHMWRGWRLLPPYRPEAVDADVARLLSRYLEQGYLDAKVHAGETRIEGREARLTIVARPGKLMPLPEHLCAWLLAERRTAQREGVLDFSARFDIEHGLSIDRGPRYRVGRIDFSGNHHYSDGFLRANLLLDEGDVFDEQRLWRSIARLNRTGRFDPIDERNVVVRPNAATGFAGISLRVSERKAGVWNISGPVGPMSLAGPLQASIASRLPAWGRGMFELSTYSVSIGLFAFAKPLIPILNPPKRFLPVLALQRAFSPGAGWISGFAIVPQLGWRNTALSYGSSQLQGRLMPLIGGERTVGPELPIIVTRKAGEAVMYCAPPKPRLGGLRKAAILALHTLGALPAF